MKKDKKELIQNTLRHIISLFESGNVPEAIKIVTFPACEKPSNYWSLANKILMYCHNTEDARTFKQWGEKDRHVKKNEKAFHIFGPKKVKIKEENENGDEVEKYILGGFVLIPVFRVEQTEGNPLDYESLELPPLPLMEKAKEWNIDVSAIPQQKSCYGYYQVSFNDTEKIRLASPHEIIFFHELCHSAHKRVIGKLKDGQTLEQEVVAELGAQALAQIVGTQMENTLGNSYKYIKSYCNRNNKNIGLVCLSVLSQVEKVLQLILDTGKEEMNENNRHI